MSGPIFGYSGSAASGKASRAKRKRAEGFMGGRLGSFASWSNAVCDQEAAFVGKIPDGPRFARDLGPHCVERVLPAGGRQIVEDFASVGEMHERAARLILEVTIAEF